MTEPLVAEKHLFVPPRQERQEISFPRIIRANFDFPVIVQDPYLENGVQLDEGVEIKDGVPLKFQEDLDITAFDLEPRVYSKKTPDEYRVLVRINKGSYRQVYGYLTKDYFTRKIPIKNSTQQTFDLTAEEDDIPW
ncbi:MAG: hypothetical protein M1365_01300 [Actinobacteria bacterium]|nr:hypothetical protein [Actinomycetota bacterium]